MIDYQTLCKQGQAFQQTKLTHKEILKREIKLFADTLARQLGLVDKYYKANITDEVATVPYVQSNIHSFVEDGFELPKVNFDLGVTLEDAPEIYPKAASFYFADKQHDVAKQAQNRFDEIWNNQKDKSDKFFNHWYDNSRPIEIRMLNDASAREQRGYQIDYETAKNRAIATARAEFSRARDKVQREASIHCVGATRTALRQLHTAEARAAVLVTNQAIRMEEERKHQRESQYREEVYKWNGLFQGHIGNSLNALRTAQQAAAAASQINPYEGWSQSVAGLSNIGGHLGTMNMAQFGVLNSHHIPAFANNLWT